ncbi:MAG: DUF3307 domain-containing protein [Bacteroidota bacterium]
MVFIIILIAHWVGDYVLQTSNMAVYKSSSLKWLLLHILTYTAILLIFGYFLFSWQVAFGFALFNGSLHLITDFFTSKLSARYQDQPRVFYPILGFDQCVHVICLYWTFMNSDLLAI